MLLLQNQISKHIGICSFKLVYAALNGLSDHMFTHYLVSSYNNHIQWSNLTKVKPSTLILQECINAVSGNTNVSDYIVLMNL